MKPVGGTTNNSVIGTDKALTNLSKYPRSDFRASVRVCLRKSDQLLHLPPMLLGQVLAPDRLRTAGGSPRFIKLGRKVLYDQRDLDQWIEDHSRRERLTFPRCARSRGAPKIRAAGLLPVSWTPR